MTKIIINNNTKTIRVPISLTAVNGKIRVKRRMTINEYGLPVAVKQIPFDEHNYVEWQIGYDARKDDLKKLEDTTLANTEFVGAKGHLKSLYELSEFIYYFYQWQLINQDTLLNIVDYLNNLNNNDLLDSSNELEIERSGITHKSLNQFIFEYTQVKYPLLINRYANTNIITEIKITEKQHAVGVQPMLYLCLPITELSPVRNLIGRVAETKEIAYFEINANNIWIFVDMLKLFGTLSSDHRHDILKIIDTILGR